MQAAPTTKRIWESNRETMILKHVDETVQITLEKLTDSGTLYAAISNIEWKGKDRQRIWD
jgi:hypothetical protein